MFKYLEFKDKTPKFWEIQCCNNELTTRYGEVGRQGLSETTAFRSEEEGQKTLDHLVKQQLEKGYKSNPFDEKNFQEIDQIMEALLAYESASNINHNLKKPGPVYIWSGNFPVVTVIF